MTKTDLFHDDTLRVLNTLTDNVFLCDTSLKLLWMNDAAKNIITLFTDRLAITHPEELITKSLKEIHDSSSSFHKVVHKDGMFPHQAKITIFEDYVASIMVNKVHNSKDQHIGYILYWQDVTFEAREKAQDKQLIEELSTPVLPTVLENTLLIPLSGTFTHSRMSHLTSKVLNEITRKDADHCIFDLSSLTLVEVEDFANNLIKLVDTVHVIGANAFIVGIKNEHASYFASVAKQIRSITFLNFREAMHHLFELEELEITSKKSKKNTGRD
ncbi:STAS domain-containing protein [Paenalkalicoccus suaedae]|uniref:STAS domain-containing protein n=1 Tax=Paenalkalicoccus suaedae TaxID=2592382 RepID=A0A859FHV9_9BACI|nr:STAS domain-containing protein [Paenalkalicoccus suaedae]QKS71805.1 STAS domain-containing protein [Paenalkalicoccus suaedae]